MRKYKIADILLAVDSSIYLSDCWKDFFQPGIEGNCEELAFSVSMDTKRMRIHGVVHIPGIIRGDRFMEADGSVLYVNKDYTQAQFISSGSIYGREELLCQLFQTHGVKRGILRVHSSLVDCQGIGILFIGPSGIGKTTQAELWEKYRQAEIINGDMVFVQEKGQDFYGVGSPWHGSSPYCLNRQVKIRAIVALKQDSVNSIRKLQDFEKVSTLAGNLFYPLWSETGMAACMETFHRLAKKVETYQLSCRPDKDAVELLYENISRGEI